MPIVVLKGSGKVQKKRKNEEDEPFHLRGMDDVLHMKVYKISQPHFFTGAVTTTLIGGDIFYKEEESEELALGLQRNKTSTSSADERTKKESVPSVLQEIRAHKYRSRKKDVDNGDFIRHVWEDGEKRKKISAGFSFHEYLEPSASPDECLAWAIRYVSTNDHNLVETFLRLDERIQRFESGKLEGIRNGKSGITGGNINNGTSAQTGKAKDGANDADRPLRTAKAGISLAQQLELIKQQGTEAFLRAIQQTMNSTSMPDNTASSGLNEESAANTERVKITNKPPSLQPRRPTDDKPKSSGNSSSGRPNPKQNTTIPTRTASFRATSPRPRLNSEASAAQSEEPVTVTTMPNSGAAGEPPLRSRGRLGSSDSVESGTGSVADTVSYSNEIMNEDSEIPGDEVLEDGSGIRIEDNNKNQLSVKSSLRPPAGPPPSKIKQGTSHAAKGGRKVRIADGVSDSKDVPSQNDGEEENSPKTPNNNISVTATDGHKNETKEKSPKKRKTQQEAIKYGNHLRPAYALYDINDHHPHSDGDGNATNNKPNQFELMRREQQHLRRSIGAALQNFARANKKQDTLQQKTKSYIDKASKAAKQLYAGFANFESAREEGSNDATHLWEEKVQLRARFLAAKMRFLSAADTPLLPPGSASGSSQQQQLSPPSSARVRTSSSARSNAANNNGSNNNNSSNNEELNRLNQLMRENQQMNRKLMEDFGKPGGQIHKDMARMRLAAQRDIESQELRALLSPNNRWFVTCVLKMREHLRRSSNTAPPCALKFIFVLQLLLKLQAAANERQQRKLKEKRIIPTAMDDYQPIQAKDVVPAQVRKIGLLTEDQDHPQITHHISLSFGPKHSPSQSPSSSPKHSQRPSPRHSRSSSPSHNIRPTSPVRVQTSSVPTIHQPPSLAQAIPQSNDSNMPVLNMVTNKVNSHKSSSIPSPTNPRSTITTTSMSSAKSQSNFDSFVGMSSPDAEIGCLDSLNVTPRILSLLLLSPIFTKDDLRKALVQQLVEVVRDGVGWAAEPFARFLEKHELPVPAELLNLLRTMAKERAAKRDRERRESSLASSASPGAVAVSRTRQSMLQRSIDSPQPTEVALFSESVPSTSRQMSKEDVAVSVDIEEPSAVVQETATPAERLEIQTNVLTTKREAVLAATDV